MPPQPQDPQRDLLTGAQGPEDPIKAAIRKTTALLEQTAPKAPPPEVMREFDRKVAHATTVENFATSGLGPRIASYGLGATAAASEGFVGSISSFVTGAANTAIDAVDLLLGRKGQISGMTMFGPVMKPPTGPPTEKFETPQPRELLAEAGAAVRTGLGFLGNYEAEKKKVYDGLTLMREMLAMQPGGEIVGGAAEIGGGLYGFARGPAGEMVGKIAQGIAQPLGAARAAGTRDLLTRAALTTEGMTSAASAGKLLTEAYRSLGASHPAMRAFFRSVGDRMMPRLLGSAAGLGAASALSAEGGALTEEGAQAGMFGAATAPVLLAAGALGQRVQQALRSPNGGQQVADAVAWLKSQPKGAATQEAFKASLRDRGAAALGGLVEGTGFTALDVWHYRDALLAGFEQGFDSPEFGEAMGEVLKSAIGNGLGLAAMHGVRPSEQMPWMAARRAESRKAWQMGLANAVIRKRGAVSMLETQAKTEAELLSDLQGRPVTQQDIALVEQLASSPIAAAGSALVGNGWKMMAGEGGRMTFERDGIRFTVHGGQMFRPGEDRTDLPVEPRLSLSGEMAVKLFPDIHKGADGKPLDRYTFEGEAAELVMLRVSLDSAAKEMQPKLAEALLPDARHVDPHLGPVLLGMRNTLAAQLLTLRSQQGTGLDAYVDRAATVILDALSVAARQKPDSRLGADLTALFSSEFGALVRMARSPQDVMILANEVASLVSGKSNVDTAVQVALDHFRARGVLGQVEGVDLGSSDFARFRGELIGLRDRAQASGDKRTAAAAHRAVLAAEGLMRGTEVSPGERMALGQEAAEGAKGTSGFRAGERFAEESRAERAAEPKLLGMEAEPAAPLRAALSELRAEGKVRYDPQRGAFHVEPYPEVQRRPVERSEAAVAEGRTLPVVEAPNVPGEPTKGEQAVARIEADVGKIRRAEEQQAVEAAKPETTEGAKQQAKIRTDALRAEREQAEKMMPSALRYAETERRKEQIRWAEDVEAAWEAMSPEARAAAGKQWSEAVGQASAVLTGKKLASAKALRAAASELGKQSKAAAPAAKGRVGRPTKAATAARMDVLPSRLKHAESIQNYLLDTVRSLAVEGAKRGLTRSELEKKAARQVAFLRGREEITAEQAKDLVGFVKEVAVPEVYGKIAEAVRRTVEKGEPIEGQKLLADLQAESAAAGEALNQRQGELVVEVFRSSGRAKEVEQTAGKRIKERIEELLARMPALAIVPMGESGGSLLDNVTSMPFGPMLLGVGALTYWSMGKLGAADVRGVSAAAKLIRSGMELPFKLGGRALNWSRTPFELAWRAIGNILRPIERMLGKGTTEPIIKLIEKASSRIHSVLRWLSDQLATAKPRLAQVGGEAMARFLNLFRQDPADLSTMIGRSQSRETAAFDLSNETAKLLLEALGTKGLNEKMVEGSETWDFWRALEEGRWPHKQDDKTMAAFAKAKEAMAYAGMRLVESGLLEPNRLLQNYYPRYYDKNVSEQQARAILEQRIKEGDTAGISRAVTDEVNAGISRFEERAKDVWITVKEHPVAEGIRKIQRGVGRLQSRRLEEAKDTLQDPRVAIPRVILQELTMAAARDLFNDIAKDKNLSFETEADAIRVLGKNPADRAFIDPANLKIKPELAGPLAGKWVHSSVLRHLRRFGTFREDFHEALAMVTSLLKKAQVTRNPRSALRQDMTQSHVMSAGGVHGYWTAEWKAWADREIESKGKWYQELQELGEVGSEFALVDNYDVMRSLNHLVRDEGRSFPFRALRAIHDTINNATSPVGELPSKVEHIYARSDQMARLIAYRVLREKRGLSKEEAATRVRELYNYRAMLPVFDALAPLFWYQRFNMKVVEALWKRGLREAPITSLMAGVFPFVVVRQLLAMLSGETEDDLAKAGEIAGSGSLSWLQRQFVVPGLGGRGEDGRLNYFDFSPNNIHNTWLSALGLVRSPYERTARPPSIEDHPMTDVFRGAIPSMAERAPGGPIYTSEDGVAAKVALGALYTLQQLSPTIGGLPAISEMGRHAIGSDPARSVTRAEKQVERVVSPATIYDRERMEGMGRFEVAETREDAAASHTLPRGRAIRELRDALSSAPEDQQSNVLIEANERMMAEGLRPLDRVEASQLVVGSRLKSAVARSLAGQSLSIQVRILERAIERGNLRPADVEDIFKIIGNLTPTVIYDLSRETGEGVEQVGTRVRALIEKLHKIREG